MSKQMVIAGIITPARVEITDEFGEKAQFEINKPEGCIGLTLAFESKKAARAYYGKRVSLISIERNLKTQKRG